VRQQAAAPWLVAAIVIVGLVIRMPRLTESLWYDEIAAWRDYGSKGAAWTVTHYYDPANHIAQTLASSLTFAALGDLIGAEASLRVPLLLASLASIVAVWGMTRAAADMRTAFLAGALMAVLPVSVLEAVEARGYAMMIAAAAGATWLMLSAARCHRWWKWALYAVVMSVGVWAHLMTLWIAVGHGVWLVWILVRGSRTGSEHMASGNEDRRATNESDRPDTSRVFAARGLIAVCGAAILTLALYAPVLDDLLRIRSQFAASTGREPNVFGVEGLHALLQTGGSWFWPTALPGLFLAAIGLIVATRSTRRRMAVALSLLGLPIMVLALWLAGSWMYARFALFALPGATLLVAIGIDRLWRWRPSMGIAFLFLVIVSAAADLAMRPAKQPLRDAADFVRANLATQREPILVIGLRHEVMSAYLGDLNLHHSRIHGEDLASMLQAIEPQWVIELFPRRVPDELVAMLRDEGFVPERRLPGWLDWGDGDVVVHRRRTRE
jgi:mannosyltransferase